MKLIAASGGVYSAFAVGTVFADSLNVLLVQDNAGTSASMEELPEGSGVGTWVVLSGALALMSCGIGAIASVPEGLPFIEGLQVQNRWQSRSLDGCFDRNDRAAGFSFHALR